MKQVKYRVGDTIVIDNRRSGSLASYGIGVLKQPDFVVRIVIEIDVWDSHFLEHTYKLRTLEFGRDNFDYYFPMAGIDALSELHILPNDILKNMVE